MTARAVRLPAGVLLAGWVLGLAGCLSSLPEKRSFEAILHQAERGDLAAQAETGNAYLYGVGVPRDPVEALKWSVQAATQGNAMAQHNLGVMYDEGIVVRQNNAEAIQWYQKAAAQGYERSRINLGVKYWRGDGLEKDNKRAWEMLNQVRTTTKDHHVRWAARRVLEEIKRELGVDRYRVSEFTFPDWDDLQESLKREE